MAPESWPQIERLYQAACERPAEERRQFLENACLGDEQLCREVESLLAFNEQASNFLETPALETTAHYLAQPLPEGTQLGPYVIAGRLGAGGMGEVYRAEDTRLGRQVAVKFLPDRLAADPGAAERFQHEARLLASLNHPHICTLYDVGPNYLVMELVEGETLAACLEKGPLPAEPLLRYSAEIAEALAAAHSLGIVHRDLKPGNIMVTKAGVKVLDLGLATLSRPDDPRPRQAETMVVRKAIMGTPAYMAPEQLRGEEADARTDLFSFGAVLYEMATGKRAFPRHLDRSPPPAIEEDNSPRNHKGTQRKTFVKLRVLGGFVVAFRPYSGLRQIIGKLMNTDRALRYQTASDVLRDLQQLQRRAGAAPAWRRWPAAASGAAAVAVAAIALWAAAGLWNYRPVKIGAGTSTERGAAAVNPKAFEAYLRARYYLDQRTSQNTNKAISFYQKAIEEEPAYALAYAGLADSYNQLGTVVIGDRSPLETRKLAIAAALRALEINPDLAEAHAALAYANLYDWNWTRAEQGFERAVALKPRYAPAHLWFAHYLAARGQFERSLREVRLANDLDPLSPIIQTQVGWMFVFARRFPEAVSQFRKTLELNPDYSWAQMQLGGALILTGDNAAATEIYEKAAAANRSPSMLGALGRAYGLAGRRREAVQVIDELLALSRQKYVSPFSIMKAYLGLWDRDNIFEWMEKCYQERTNGMAWLAVDPEFDPIRTDPRFEMYLRRIGLPNASTLR